MSDKKKSSQENLGQGSIKKLSDLEELILQDEAAKFSASGSALKDGQSLKSADSLTDDLAALEGNLLQDAPAELDQQRVDETDDGALWDSIAELEVDFLYDELGDADADGPVAEVEAEPEPTAVSEAPALTEDVLSDDMAAPIEPVEALPDESVFGGTGRLVLALEDEILSEPVVVEEAPTPVEDVAEMPMAAAMTDEEPLLEISEAIEMAFAAEDEVVAESEPETAVSEPDVVAVEDPELDVAAEWNDLADVEAALFTEPDVVDVGEMAELSQLETDLFQEPAAEEVTPVLEEAEALEESEAEAEADDNIFEAFFAEAEAAEAEAAIADVVDDETAEVVEQAGETAVFEQPEDTSDAEDLEFIAELEAEKSHFLDDLIASIDNDLAATKANETMIDLAAPTAAEAGTLVQYVIFTLDNIKCAVPANNIREVGELNYITAVPNVPEWLMGITSLRGDILSLVDLGGFLGLARSEERGLTVSEVEIMVVQSQHEDLAGITTGLVVDEVDDIQDIAIEQVRMPTASLDNKLGTYMRGMYEDNGEVIILLDLERLLMSPEMWQFEAI